MSGKIMKTNPSKAELKVVEQAAELLRRGGVLLYPTDTLYGLGAAVRNHNAIDRVYAAKGRPAHQPLPVLVGSLGQLDMITLRLPETTISLLDQLWPGALTVVLPARTDLPPQLLSHGSSIAVRWPDAPLAAALCLTLGSPITATSANLSGRSNAESFEAAYDQVGHSCDLAIDAGPPPAPRGSTIIDLSTAPYRLLRRGIFPEDRLQRSLGNLVDATNLDD